METDKQGLITHYENAEKMYEEGKLEEAISEFGKIIELAPKNQLAAKATNFIGDIYFDKGDDANAEVYYKEAIKIDPNLIEAYRNLGHAYFNQEKYDDAIIQYEKVIDANPDAELKAECLESIGDIYYDKEDYANAEVYFKEAIKIDQNLIEAYWGLGQTYFSQEKYDDALTEYDKILELNVDNDVKSETLRAIGQIHVLKGDNNQALKKFSEAKELDNTLEDAHLQLASEIYDFKGEDEGLDQFKKIIESNPNSELAAKVYIEIGNIYSGVCDSSEKEDYIEAEKNYREAIKISPNSKLSAMALNGIGDIYYAQKKKDIAIENYKEAIKIDPDFEDAHYNLSVTFEDKKMHHEALLEIDEAIRINPNNSAYYNHKGTIYWRRQYPKAIEAYEKAMKIEPKEYWPYDNLARLHENKKQKEKAIEVWIKCLRYADLDEEGRNKTGKVKKHLNKLGITEKEIEKLRAKMQPSEPFDDMNTTSKDSEEPPKAIGIFELSRNTFLQVDFLEKIKYLLEDKHQLIFYGVPGTGKTFVAKEFANFFANCATDQEIKNRVTLIQFHQSYGYEEFMEGIRPEPLDDNKGMNYPIKSGIFKTFCDEAGKNRDKKYLLIIDEINRGNISKIFGELLFLLEYRDNEITLPYSKKPFSIPDNVYIIGTMNTADRSIAFVDYALRRRFYFVEFLPNKEVLEKWLNENPDKRSGIDVLNLFTKLNDTIKNDLDEHHQIGHSYFMIEKGILDEKMLKLIWDYNIMPLLKEYFFTKTNLDKYSFDSMIKG